MEADNNIQLPELILGDIREHPLSKNNPDILTKVRIDRPHDVRLWFTVRRNKQENSEKPFWIHPANRQRSNNTSYDDIQYGSELMKNHYEKFAIEETEKFLKSKEKSPQTEDKKTSTEEA